MGPLTGVRVVEIAGIGPGPFCCMMLADMGADVLRVDRVAVPGGHWALESDVLTRGRRSVGVDLKHPSGAGVVLRLVEQADALVEGFRPGVVERLGIGPEECQKRNPRLIYGRMTGWGQDGPMAGRAGHDIDYIAVAGVLHLIGRRGEAPVPPLNLVGDYGGGGMLLAFGIAAALVERERSGTGQVIDAAMVDGAALLATSVHGYSAAGLWGNERGANLLDTGAPFYDVYETADGRYIAIGALEPQFHAELLDGLGLDPTDLAQMDRESWPQVKERFREAIRQKTRDEWVEIFDGTDACVAPVLSLEEAPQHPHNVERSTFAEVSGVVQPSPAPRFSRTPGEVQGPPPRPGQHTDEALQDWGFGVAEIAGLKAAGAIR